MKNSEFIKGVDILSKHIPEDSIDGFSLCAVHDQIYFCDSKWVEEGSDDYLMLEELGWFIDEESWSCFT